MTFNYRNKVDYKSGYKYVLQQDVYFDLTKLSSYAFPNFEHEFFSCQNDLLVVKRNYAWDGPSGPTLDTKNFMAPSLLHDVFYQAIREDLLSDYYQIREVADELLYWALKAEGMNTIRAWYVYQAVSKFGAEAAVSSREIKTV